MSRLSDAARRMLEILDGTMAGHGPSARLLRDALDERDEVERKLALAEEQLRQERELVASLEQVIRAAVPAKGEA